MSLSAATRTEILRQKERYPRARSAVLPSLWALQHEAGHLTIEGMREVAELLGLTPSEVQAVATFYSMYFDHAPGEHTALVCVNVSCALRGADDIVAHMEKRLGCASGGTSKDGKFTWESTVECLGACGGAPAMQIDHHFHEDLTPDAVDAILDQYAARASATPHAAEGHAAPAGKHEADGAAASAPESRRHRADAGEGGTAPAPAAKKTSRTKRPRAGADNE